MKHKVIVIEGINYHYFKVFKDDDRQIGWACLEIGDRDHYTFKDFCNEKPERCAHITIIKTEKSERNKGVATAILDKIVKRYEDWDLFLQVIPLDSTNTVQSLTSFYRKFGFERCEFGGLVPTMVKPAKI